VVVVGGTCSSFEYLFVPFLAFSLFHHTRTLTHSPCHLTFPPAIPPYLIRSRSPPFLHPQMETWTSALKADVDGDKKLSEQEIVQAFAEQGRAFFKALDKDKSGSVDKAEYEAYGRDIQEMEQ